MIASLDHIGIATHSLNESLEQYSEKLGMQHSHTEDVKSENVRVAILNSGSTRVELLEPTSETSPVAQFLKKRGGGVHHLAFSVDDIEAEVLRLKEKGVQLIEPAPRPGAQGTRVAFIHPKSTGGVLIELVQRPGKK